MGSACNGCKKRTRINTTNSANHRSIERKKKDFFEPIYISKKSNIDDSKKNIEVFTLKEPMHHDRSYDKKQRSVDRSSSLCQSQFIAVVHKEDSPKHVDMPGKRSGVLLEFQAISETGGRPIPCVSRIIESTNKCPNHSPLLSPPDKTEISNQAQHSNLSSNLDEDSEAGSGIFPSVFIRKSTYQTTRQKEIEMRRFNTKKMVKHQTVDLPSPLVNDLVKSERGGLKINRNNNFILEFPSQFAQKKEDFSLEQESLDEQLCSSSYQYKKRCETDVSKMKEEKKRVRENMSQYKRVVKKNLLKTLKKGQVEQETGITGEQNPRAILNTRENFCQSRSSSTVKVERLNFSPEAENVRSSDAYSPHLGFAPNFYNPGRDKNKSYSFYFATHHKEALRRIQTPEATLQF